MELKGLIICGAVFLLASCNKKVPQLGTDSIESVVNAMTLEEKATLTIGTGMAGFTGESAVVGESNTIIAGAAGTTQEIPRLGIPSIVLADGPAGVRISPKREGSDRTYYATAFPTGTLLASTWNTSLVEEVGKTMGDEALEYGIDILLTPALNIHRNPLCGRNFEYYSEDPLVSGKIAAAMINGIQASGVGTSIKHYAANNQETNRTSSDSRLTQRALREIYLKGFEIGIKESKPWTVMSAYNYINGVYAPENYELLTTVLRDEWGYKGVVMTDWFGGESAPKMIHAGNELLMPGLTSQKEEIIEAVEKGTLTIEDLDKAVTRILELVVQTPRFKKYKYTESPDLNSHAAVSRQSASEGMILLKNDNTLPLAKDVKKIAAYGITSYDFISGGAGSGDVNSAYTVSLVDGLASAGYMLNSDLQSRYEKYITIENNKLNANKNKEDKLASHTAGARPKELIPNDTELKAQAATADIALITIGRVSGEFLDRKIDGDFNLTTEELRLINKVTEVYHSQRKKVVVILNVGGVIETASWKNIPDAILLTWLAGQEGGNSVADVISGKTNPSGKLTMSFPIQYADVSSATNFPYDFVHKGNLTESMLARNPERKNLVRNVDYTVYEEDIYVGYRFFNTFNKAVSYPFGYGLSYTQFEYSVPKIKAVNSGYEISLTVKNTGSVKGKEIVQVYVAAPLNDNYGKPTMELKAFDKTRELMPNEEQEVKMYIAKLDLASFDQTNSSWVVDPGLYKFMVGSSSVDIKHAMNIDIEEKMTEKVNDVLRPQEEMNFLKSTISK
ncbi:glycoside hydrolase family 3 protein [Dysgonomonas sp. Marseille-P4677]|uniref:beta-glucosidase family protein n=1 Tax=Dysgonomonas sp. Marseille-P4677 TaxID=2364790 RepID=UPI001913EC18|nr:beta-glucosidase [Dysgonomonas sp. Marseille-P4677]MBK5720928.1 glycoside hydrolase family 3 protein [Dysgonomonas sp. Marseille-P4677]